MKQKNQSGSGHVLIIVILVLALFASLGYIYLRNYTDVFSSDAQTVSKKVDTTDKKADAINYTEISRWGVKGVYDGDGSIECIHRSTGGAEASGDTVNSSVDDSCDFVHSDGAVKYSLSSAITRYAADEVVYNMYIGQRPTDNGQKYYTASELFSVDKTDMDLSLWSFESNNYASKHIGDYYYVYTLNPGVDGEIGTTKGSDSKIFDYFKSLKAAN